AEAGTLSHCGAAALDYTGAWVGAVRAAGFRPGVYTSPDCLAALSRRPPAQLPGFVWVASWLKSFHVNPALDPIAAPGLSRQLWRHRQRAGAYLGSVRVPGAASAVDVSCSNLELAHTP